ncbi:MAG: hypothetical protein ACJA13_001335 [Paraglaciecola sp.]|jgi:hypothetical protein
MQEPDLLDKALDTLNAQTKLGLEYKAKNPTNKYCMEAILTVPATNIRLHVICKKWLNHTHLPTLLRQLDPIKLEQDIAGTLLVTEYVNPNLAQRLKAAQIQYIDIAGNAYINQGPVYIDIQGKRPEKFHQDIVKTMQAGKAFLPKGMKVIYMLLTEEELLNQPFRTIAQRAEVALGTVKQVMDDLNHQGYVVEKGKKQRLWINRARLLDKWVEAYPVNIQGKYALEVFTTNDDNWWKTQDLNNFDGLWGAEVAAAHYTHYLTPKDALIYIPANQKVGFVKAARLRKPANDEKPDVRVILAQPFMEIGKLRGEQTDLAHPLVVYANLMASADGRNIDTAGRLYEQYLG